MISKASRFTQLLVFSTTALILALTTLSSPAQTAPPADCMTCHEDRTLSNTAGKSLFVDLDLFKKSLHGDLGVSCVQCHSDLKKVTDFPHAEKPAPADCRECHENAVTSFSHGVHAKNQTKLGDRSLRCSDCHNAHSTLASKKPNSPTSPIHVQDLCLKCHRSAAPESPGRSRDFVASYEESIHAKVVKKAGLSISATCVTCHGSHDVRVVSDPASPVARKNIPTACGSCHAGILQEYNESVHGRSLLTGEQGGPVCTSCHGEHKVQSPTMPSSRVYTQNVPETCGACHQDERIVQQYNLAKRRVSTFGATFHGIALRFGELRAANCASCHGYHDILPASDRRSRIHPDNIPKTCGECHPNAGTNWARGKVHLAVPKTDNYGVYITLQIYRVGIGGMMAVFVLYILADLWGLHRRRGKVK